jgi:hypothetical protein
MKTRKKTAKKLWFRAKEFGWGWYPCTCWLGAAEEAGGAGSRGDMLAIGEFVVLVVLLTYALFRVCYRYGEEPRWRWGKRD